MRFPIPDEYKVVYRYVSVQAKRAPKQWQHLTMPLTIATQALIYAPNSDIPVARGYAIKNPADMHNRRIGRDIARGRAAKALAQKLAQV